MIDIGQPSPPLATNKNRTIVSIEELLLIRFPKVRIFIPPLLVLGLDPLVCLQQEKFIFYSSSLCEIGHDLKILLLSFKINKERTEISWWKIFSIFLLVPSIVVVVCALLDSAEAPCVFAHFRLLVEVDHRYWRSESIRLAEADVTCSPAAVGQSAVEAIRDLITILIDIDP